MKDIFKKDFWFPICFRKLYNPDTLKYRWQLEIGYHSLILTGFWFGKI